jgi:hypothetical protein
VVVGLAAISIGVYSHGIIAIPAIAAGAIAVLLSKARLIEDRLLVQAVSVQGGNAVLMLFDVFMSTVDTIFRIETFGYALAVVVLAIHPRKWLVVVLLVYQGIRSLLEAVHLWIVPIGSGASRAFAGYVGFSVLGVVLLAMLLRRGLPITSERNIAQVFE